MIELIKDVNKCESTCYFEFLPGKFNKKCWNNESVFIYYLHICYIEPILEKHICNYDHYSFMSADKLALNKIIHDLSQLTDILQRAKNLIEFTTKLNFSFRDIEENFTKDFRQSKIELMKMIGDFVLWIRETIKSHNQISVLGM
jgi:hypothetical protein